MDSWIGIEALTIKYAIAISIASNRALSEHKPFSKLCG